MTPHPQKILAGRYQVVPRSIILLTDGDKVLLQKASAQKKIYPGTYNGIGGHIERGEDVLDGAKRELREEAGISCTGLQLAGTIMIDVQEDIGILLFVFCGDQIEGELRSSNEGTLHWIEMAKLDEFPVVEDIPELLEKILDFRATGKMFYGRYLYNEENERFASWQ
jgi:8-oxo-dGTP diphosphatase